MPGLTKALTPPDTTRQPRWPKPSLFRERAEAAMATVALVVHPARAEATEVAKAATAWLTEGGHDVRVMSSHPDDETRRAWAESNSELSLAVSLGGDGTMLSTVNLAVPRGIPILGV